MPRTLVTGGNSFVGAHVINELLDAGHTVVGTVRRAAAGDEVLATNPEWKGKVEMVVVPDYGKEADWDGIFKASEYDHVSRRAAETAGCC